jgi:hypothetical protein
MLAFKTMHVHTRSHRSRSHPRIARGVARGMATAAETRADAVPQPEQPSPQARERAAGGPDDRAAYRCACGCVFEAPVSTTVGCPHCGGAQAW